MKSLAKTNPYIRNAATRHRWLEENARESSVFEGARGLSRPGPQPPAPKRRVKASAKNRVRSS